jgi:hypothetical protein
MQKQITFKNINEDTFFTEQFWKKFKEEFESWLENFSLELKKIYPQKLKNLTQNEIANYLFVPACRDYLNEYQSFIVPKSTLEKAKTFKHNLRKSTFVRVDRYSDEIEFSKNEFFRFFYRHKALFPKYCQYDKDDFKKKNSLFFLVNPRLQLLLNKYSFKTIKFIEQIATLLANIDLFSKIKKLPKNIFTSSHWAQNNSLHQAFLTYARSKGTSIYILQCSFANPFFAFDDQFEFEKRMASHYITWQSGSLDKNSGKVELGFGSLYCSRKSTKQSGTCVVLPAIPLDNYLRGRSISFGLGKTLFYQSKAFSYIKKYIFDLAESSNKTIYLRSKSLDLMNYKSEFKILKDKIKFDSGDVNNGGHLTPFEDMRIGYFGTAIPEAFFNGSSVSLVYHPSNEIVLNSKYSEFNKYPINESIPKLCKPAEIESFESLFSKLGL